MVMENIDVKIEYLYNSGFTVETENFFLVFDYWKSVYGRDVADRLPVGKKVVVFASHSHGDHYNPDIFLWRERNPGIDYVLSSEIRPKAEGVGMHRMSRYRQLELGGLSVKTFGSTDLGVSFLVKADGISIFHAGDLNWWDWYDETPENNRAMEERFKKEISRIKGEEIDIAFFPVDPRLKESYRLGADYFVSEVGPRFLIPMHYGEDAWVNDEFPDLARFAGQERTIER
jgi:L-ascorbate metabolism protein UlaG (beta-lactamase superfamily)